MAAHQRPQRDADAMVERNAVGRQHAMGDVLVMEVRQTLCAGEGSGDTQLTLCCSINWFFALQTSASWHLPVKSCES